MKTKFPNKAFVYNIDQSWEWNYRALEKQYKEETDFLIKRIEELETAAEDYEHTRDAEF